MTPGDPVLVQAVAFAVATLAGVAVGLVLDAYRAVRRVLLPPRWLGHALDVVFVALCLPLVAAGLLLANWGEARLYPVVGLALGAVLYLRLGSPLVLPAWVWSLRLAWSGGRAAVLGVTWPVRAPLAAGLRWWRARPRRGPIGLP